MRISTQYLNQRGVNSIVEQQVRLARIQEQIASGKRIVHPSDDPSGATQVIRLTQTIKVTGQYQRNAVVTMLQAPHY